MSLLDKTIQYFPGKIWLPKPLGEISLKQFIDSHKKPRKQIKEIFKQIAEAEKKEDWETKGKLKQNNLFYFTPCVKFNGKSRGYADIESFTGFMVLDFDHLEIGAEEFRDRLFKKYKCIVCAYKSPSSNGVKAIVRIPIVDSVDEFKQYFYAMCMEMAKVNLLMCLAEIQHFLYSLVGMKILDTERTLLFGRIEQVSTMSLNLM